MLFARSDSPAEFAIRSCVVTVVCIIGWSSMTLADSLIPSPPLPGEEQWEVQVIPRQPRRAAEHEGGTYESLYQAIPFRRSEYLANPSYRHDAAMELLFGEQRPTVVHRGDIPQRVVNPRPVFSQPYRMSIRESWDFLRDVRPPLGDFSRWMW